MSKQNKWLIINTGIVILFSILVVLFVTNLIPTTKEDKLFNQVISLVEVGTIETKNAGDYAVISTHFHALDLQENKIGDVYLLEIKNGYGMMSLYVGIQENLIYTQNILLDQTSVYLKNIQHFIQTQLNGITYDRLKLIPPFDAAYDLNTGATATDSTASILGLVIKAADIHFGFFIDDPYIAYYGENYTKVLDPNVTSEAIQKYIINDTQTIYSISGVGSYEGYEETKTGNITIDVLLDENNNILALLFPEDQYEHTRSFLNRNTTYINYFIGLNVSELGDMLTTHSDLATGATGSKVLIESLLRTLFEEVVNDE